MSSPSNRFDATQKETQSLLSPQNSPQSSRSYKSFSNQYNSHPACIEHSLQKDETLQSIAIKYGVNVGDIRLVNNMWAQDSICFKKILLIPQKPSSPSQSSQSQHVRHNSSNSNSSSNSNNSNSDADIDDFIMIDNNRHSSREEEPNYLDENDDLLYEHIQPTATFSSSPLCKVDPKASARLAKLDDEINPL